MLFYISNYSYKHNVIILCLFLSVIWLLNACAPQPPISSPGHLNAKTTAPLPKDDIPPPVQQVPFVPLPQPTPSLETYTVVVDDVPVDKLLFALARDAGINVDIHPDISGHVTLNAVNQTLPQLLERIAKQVDLRYQIEGTHVSVFPDRPYIRLYKVSYVNMQRDSTSQVTVATQIISDLSTPGSGSNAGGGSSGGSGGNNSTTRITNTSNNRFWETLEKNIQAILASEGAKKGAVAKTATQDQVVVNPEGGVVTVRATSKQHEEIQRFLDQVIANVQRQVLIEATIAEVRLSDQYQAGVDWQRIAGDFTYTQSLVGGNLGVNAPFYTLRYSNPQSQFGNLSATLQLLEQFGNVKVLSSPKIMALNNQTAILKVVENTVYFTSEVEINETETRTRERFTTEINTVPVGLVMNVTPQISDNDVVTLNVRPTISRIIGFKTDPNPILAEAGTINRIPEIQVREIESILKVNNGDIAVLGGLMQDSVDQGRAGIPVLSKLPMVGDLFSYRDDKYEKTELIIFLRPVVVKEASLEGDLRDYQAYLPEANQSEAMAPTGLLHP
jgi:general secretion pathway protein D